MHFKLSLLSGLVAVASSLSTVPFQNSFKAERLDQSLLTGKQYVTQYVKPNAEEICFSVRPIAVCGKDYVSTRTKHQKVGFHCVDSESSLANKLVNRITNGEQLSWEQKSQDIEAYVEVPMSCEIIQDQWQVWKKQNEQSHEWKIHLVQPKDTEQSICSDVDDHLSSGKRDQNNSVHLDYTHFYKQKISIQNLFTLSRGDFEQWYTMLKTYVRQVNHRYSSNNLVDSWYHHASNVLPTSFGNVAKNFFETVLSKNMVQVQTEEFYEEYKEFVKRTYAWFIQNTLEHVEYFSDASDYTVEWKKLVNKVLYKIQGELTSVDLEKVNKMLRLFKQEKSKNDVWTHNFLTTYTKEQWETLEQDLSDILVSSLVFVYKQMAQSQNQNTEYINLLTILRDF